MGELEVDISSTDLDCGVWVVSSDTSVAVSSVPELVLLISIALADTSEDRITVFITLTLILKLVSESCFTPKLYN